MWLEALSASAVATQKSSDLGAKRTLWMLEFMQTGLVMSSRAESDCRKEDFLRHDAVVRIHACSANIAPYICISFDCPIAAHA